MCNCGMYCPHCGQLKPLYQNHYPYYPYGQYQYPYPPNLYWSGYTPNPTSGGQSGSVGGHGTGVG